ncbi:glutathione S-transferase family protein [Achromobacter sp. GG226]|uniref:glutathione S-transferase family protein n=1 Tax=Verticiella alkaliphila TaxID=2779529 RepID=UPI001C0C071D|nr:glutathione S-transferase family protein [Verticiella sp. GG226]MBU4611546.1 glutathione S-transferase family protein [Verticiella sp. GG226]
MQLHWSPKSPYVRKVMVCALELGVADRLTRVRSVAAMLRPNPDIMRDNPLSKIPTLVLDDGMRLFDSVVICEYLNDLAEGSLFPTRGQAKWDALRWHALGDGMLDALILWRNERERTDAQRLEALVDAFSLKFANTLAVLEAEAPALAAAPLSIGTITVGCMLGYADFRFDAEAWRTRAPALADWYATLAARPSFQATSPDLDLK